MYEPKEDSFLLSKIVKSKSKGLRVLDMGCGSGVQMKSALEGGASFVLGVDIDAESVSFCRKKGLNVVKGDLFSGVEEKFDLIIFNPPYLPSDSREDSSSALATSGGKKGDEIIVRFLSQVSDYLDEGGRILLVVSSLTPLSKIGKVLKAKGFMKKVIASEKVFMEKLEVWDIRKS